MKKACIINIKIKNDHKVEEILNRLLKSFIKHFKVPWRLKHFVANRFSVLYYFIVNFNLNHNSRDFWDKKLEESWDDINRIWPTKNELIYNFTNLNDKILDIGCGNGSILRYLKKRGYKKLHGLEMSSYSIKKLSSENIIMHFSKLPKIDIKDNSFDIVIASEVLEHIIRHRRFLKEIRRVVKNNGKVFIFVPDNCMGPLDLNEHVRKYSKDSLEKLLKKYFLIHNIMSVQDRNHNMPTLLAIIEKRN